MWNGISGRSSTFSSSCFRLCRRAATDPAYDSGCTVRRCRRSVGREWAVPRRRLLFPELQIAVEAPGLISDRAGAHRGDGRDRLTGERDLAARGALLGASIPRLADEDFAPETGTRRFPARRRFSSPCLSGGNQQVLGGLKSNSTRGACPVTSRPLMPPWMSASIVRLWQGSQGWPLAARLLMRKVGGGRVATTAGHGSMIRA